MKLLADDVLDDLREYIASRGFTMTATLAEVFGWIERFSESVGNDPYPHFFLLGLLRVSHEFRDLVARLGGDPDAGAELVESEIEPEVEEEYGDNPLYSELKYRTEERPAIIDYAIESARIDGRTELQVRDLVIALVRYELHLDKTEGDAGQWLDHTMRTPFLTLAHIAGQFDKSLDVKLVEVRRAVRGEPGAKLPKHTIDGIRRFLEDYPDMRRNGFVIMPFAARHDAVRVAIEETLSTHHLRALRADASSYASDLLSNIEVYMHACGFAVALYDPANANVVYEAGYMRALGKPVCLLVPRGAPMHADVAGLLRVDFDPSDVDGSIRSALSKWLTGERIVE
jgi:hypothetical protein